MSRSLTIVWFRRDLRLHDNPALTAAAEHGAILPVYIHNSEDGPWAPGTASQLWLQRSLDALAMSLSNAGLRLILRRGEPLRVLRELLLETGAERVFWNRCYEPEEQELEVRIQTALEDGAVQVRSFKGSLLFEPKAVATQTGDPYKVFTPFWRQALKQLPRVTPLPAPPVFEGPSSWPRSATTRDLGAGNDSRAAGHLFDGWSPGEDAALRRLDVFMERILAGYDDDRDRPDHDGTSRLSPHLHFGEISPRTILARLMEQQQVTSAEDISGSAFRFLTEIGWREFAHHLLAHFPETVDRPLRREFDKMPWANDPEGLAAWQEGRTGYPIIDAGMRQLHQTGWMHNRVRMIVASFLTKDLLIPWQEGARWFWDHLVDADLANNTLGWQWTAGCGADAAPYFRIFNPVLQGENHDPRGDYVRTWVPALSKLPDRWIHKPWEAPDKVLAKAGVSLGETYPRPIVDHAMARKRALHAYETMKMADETR